MYQPAIDLDASRRSTSTCTSRSTTTVTPRCPSRSWRRRPRTSGRTAHGPTVDAVARVLPRAAHGGRRLHRRRAYPAGHQPLSSADIARAAAEHADVLIPFGSVDPRTGGRGDRIAERLIEEEGVRGFKFHPTVQGFDPSDDEYPPLWGLAGAPASRRSSTPGRPASARARRGATGCGSACRTRSCSTPSPPTSPTCRSSWPTRRCPGRTRRLSVATHKHNTWIDLSGWSPKYFPAELVRYANSMLKDGCSSAPTSRCSPPTGGCATCRRPDLKPDVLPGHPEGQRGPTAGPCPVTTRGNAMTTTITYDRARRPRRHRPRPHRVAHVTQDQVDLFADATDDHQWIHVDPERAKDRPVRRPDRARLPHPLARRPVLDRAARSQGRDHEGELRPRQGALPRAGRGRGAGADAGHRRRGRRGSRRLPARCRPDDRDRGGDQTGGRRARAVPLLRLSPGHPSAGRAHHLHPRRMMMQQSRNRRLGGQAPAQVPGPGRDHPRRPVAHHVPPVRRRRGPDLGGAAGAGRRQGRLRRLPR